MQGKILKGISGFYYVHIIESGIYECKAKGVFRQQGIKPLVGDLVEIDIIDEIGKKGNIVRVLPRRNALIRPAVANVDMALIVFAAATPDPNFNLLDRFLVLMARQNVPVCICFNKSDLVSEETRQTYASAYEACGYPVEFISVKQDQGIDRLMEQRLEKFLLRNSIMCINDFLYQLFHIRRGLGAGVLFLPDCIRDNHVI